MDDCGEYFDGQRRKLKDNDPECTNPDFSFFDFDDDTAEALGDALTSNTQPLKLSMSIGEGFTVRGANAMAEGLRLSHTTKFEFECKVMIDPRAKEIIFRGLEPMRYLDELVLHLKWGLDDSDAKLLWWSLKDKPLELFSFWLSPNITEPGRNALVAICRNSNQFVVRPAPQGDETMSQEENNVFHQFITQAKEDSDLQFEIEDWDDHTSDNSSTQAGQPSA